MTESLEILLLQVKIIRCNTLLDFGDVQIAFICGERGGDIISYTQKKYDLLFSGALEKLGNEWRVV